MELISCQLLCLMMHRVLSPRKDLFTIALNWKCLNERGERDRNPFTHTYTQPRSLQTPFGPIGAITLSIHVRHKIYVCIPSGHYCCLCWCGELSLQWVVGLRACRAADSLCVRVCVSEREGEWEREIDRERQGWVTQQREKHKRALP